MSARSVGSEVGMRQEGGLRQEAGRSFAASLIDIICCLYIVYQ